MDQRQTFSDTGELLAILTNHHIQNTFLAFLIDQNGLSRINGYIESIDKINSTLSLVIAHALSRHRILLDEIVAVNGIFRSDYSEC